MKTNKEKSFEEKQQEVAKLNMIDDPMFRKVAEDPKACEELLRVLMETPDLQVVEVRTQESFNNLASKSVTLDVLCTDSSKRIFNIEMQKWDNDDHQKRVRSYSANIDTFLLDKGMPYNNLPDVYVIYISTFDIFKSGRNKYNIDRVIRETGEIADNGYHEIYVNARGKGKIQIEKLMAFFENSVGPNPDFPELSKRVDYLKNTKKGVEEMSAVIEKLYGDDLKKAYKEGEKDRNLQIAKTMLKDGMELKLISKYSGLSESEIEELQRELLN